MREPTLQTRLLASPPIFYGAWGLALWLGYQWTFDEGIWPLLVALAFPMAAIMRAEQEVKAHTNWKREWDAMAGLPPPPKRWPLYLGLTLGVPFTAFLAGIAERGGVEALAGLAILFFFPLLALGLTLKLIGALLPRRGRKPVVAKVSMRCPLLNVPSVEAAYRGLPDYCQKLLAGRSS